MALTIKSLASGRLPAPSYIDQDANKLYQAPAGTKSAVVKSLILVNTAGTEKVVRLYYLASGAGVSARTLIGELGLAAGGKASWVDITLAPGDYILGDAPLVDEVDYVLSGAERDV